jgi:AcrR family transcriptional regulator
MVMKQPAKTVRPMSFESDKPAKQRILEASDRLFRLYGIRAGVQAIAQESHSNSETVLKHFGHPQRLIGIFVKSLIEIAEKALRETDTIYPDYETRLRGWIWMEMQEDDFGAPTLLSRTAAELQQYPTRDKLLVEIETYWRAERRWVTELCTGARFREPRELADKILLLVHGARNERKAFGFDGPRGRLSLAADDLMVAHGATRKPPFIESFLQETE